MPRTIALAALLLVCALYVGAYFVSHTLLQTIVQTAPLGLVVAFGLRRSQWCKWVALPCFVAWIFLLTLYTLLETHPLEESSSGAPSLVGIVSMAAAGVLAIIGTVLCIRMKTGIRGTVAAVVLGAVFILQVGAFRISFLPVLIR